MELQLSLRTQWGEGGGLAFSMESPQQNLGLHSLLLKQLPEAGSRSCPVSELLTP